VKPVLKLVVIAAAGALLAKKGTPTIWGVTDGRAFEFGGVEGDVGCCY
jgi:hypothetical protein